MKVTISVKELLAANVFSSDDESRYVLNGILIEAKPKALPLLVATDGRRLAVIETQAEQESLPDVEFSFVLQKHFIKAIHSLAKLVSIKLFPLVTIEANPGSKRALFHFMAGKHVLDIEDGALIEGTYPAWREVVPTGDKTPISQLGVNSEFVGDFAKAAKFLDVSDPLIQLNIFSQEGAMEIRMAQKPNFYAVLMPCKIDDMEYQPEFLGIKTHIEQKAA